MRTSAVQMFNLLKVLRFMWTNVRFCWKYHPAESQGLVCLTGKCQWEVNCKLNFNKVELFLPQFTSNLLPVQKYLYSLSCIDIKKNYKNSRPVKLYMGQ